MYGMKRLVVGSIPTLMPYFVARHVPPFLKQYPEVDLQLVEHTTSRLIDALQAGDVDLAVAGAVDRDRLYSMQTPQIFERNLLEQAYRAVADEKLSVTDEVSAVESLGRKVVLVPNDDFNFKITYPRDLPLAEFVLRQRAVKK